MTDTTNTTESTAIDLSLRFYKYIKSTSVTGIVPAIIELLTNSIDAHNRTDITESQNVNIIMDYPNRILTVYDNATGIDGDKLIECFGQVGNYTSTEGSRGFFSKGAKDVSAIGNMTFTSIKNGKFSQCTLTTNDMFTLLVSNRDVTTQEREQYNIPNSGLHIQVNIISSVSLISELELTQIPKYYSIRDILEDSQYNIHLNIINKLGESFFNSRIMYTTPSIKKLLIDEEFLIPGYEDRVDENGNQNFKARFIVHELEESATIDTYDKYKEYGILVTTSNAIHDLTTFYNDIRNHPKIYNIVGRLECDNIDTLMYEYDIGKIDERNPFPLIDPSRVHSIDKTHPFIRALYSRPHNILKFVLQNLYEQEIDNNTEFDFSDVFKNLDVFGDEFYEKLKQLIFPFKKINQSKVVKVIDRSTSNVLSVNPEATYKTDNLSEMVDDPNGIYEKNIPSFKVKFVTDTDSELAYRIFTLDFAVMLEININDFFLSKYVEYADEKIHIKDKHSLGIVLIDIISEALSLELIKYIDIGRTKEQLMSRSVNDIMIDIQKYRNVFVPRLYNLIITQDKLSEVIVH